MWTWAGLLLLETAAGQAAAQRRWDGQGGDSLWQNARNWQPDGVPLPDDTVLLDHSLTARDYLVRLDLLIEEERELIRRERHRKANP